MLSISLYCRLKFPIVFFEIQLIHLPILNYVEKVGNQSD